MTQELVEFKKLPDGVLRIEIAGTTAREKNINRREIMAVRDEYERRRKSMSSAFLEVCEYQLCNGWETVNTEDIGALTSSILFSEDICMSDEGDVIYCGEVYWNRAYALRLEIDDLLQQGYVDFHCERTDAAMRVDFLERSVAASTVARSEVVGWYFCERWDEDGSEHGLTYWGTGEAVPKDRYYCIHCALNRKLWNYTGKQWPITRHVESIYTHWCDDCGQLLADVEVQYVYHGVTGWRGQPRLAL